MPHRWKRLGVGLVATCSRCGCERGEAHVPVRRHEWHRWQYLTVVIYRPEHAAEWSEVRPLCD